MSETTIALTLQLLQWLAARPRDYREVMEAWRTSCPRLTIWEDAWSDGLLARDPDTGQVAVSEKGRALLDRQARR
ncbi:MAG TPA: hypothetical protein VGU20_04095 [Stellaceae bacterium]|nr:hypothetical protein [Stellaceae bacterium]